MITAMKRNREKEQVFLNLINQFKIVVKEDGSAFSKKEKSDRHANPEGIYRPIPTHGNGRGYVLARITHKGKRYSIMYHHLVWLYFNGPVPEGKEINHINGDKTDNRVSNLELVERGENIRHAWDVSLRNRKRAKTTPVEVIEAMVRMNKAGFNYREISEIFAINRNTVGDLVRKHKDNS